ncbi:hypothetical protein ABEB36_000236 [Hypothenemus hampei]|uniref:Uncharacterized protein n=1 Tax=Hypothenemus hampei TaxID=57062 RepID=A0ABD1FB45_HYPHA
MSLVPYSCSESDNASSIYILESEELNIEVNNELKKRKRSNKENWTRVKNKRLRMEGQKYLGFNKTEDGKIQQTSERIARSLKPACKSEACRKSTKRRCIEFSKRIRKNIFHKFWKDMNWKERKIFVNSLVLKKSTVRKTCTGQESRRNTTFHYFLHTY